jgi:hypothetical protein
LREVGIEYGEGRSGSKGTRCKTLTKKEPARDRRHRQNRQPNEEVLQNGQKLDDDSDEPTDDVDYPRTNHRQYESPANGGFTDDSEGADDGMQLGSNKVIGEAIDSGPIVGEVRRETRASPTYPLRVGGHHHL